MIPYPFTYHRAGSLADAQALLQRSPDAKILAGGHTLIPAMKLRLANPAALIDISGVAELSYIREQDGRIAIGAATKHVDVATSDVVRTAIPALAHLADEIGERRAFHGHADVRFQMDHGLCRGCADAGDIDLDVVRHGRFSRRQICRREGK